MNKIISCERYRCSLNQKNICILHVFLIYRDQIFQHFKCSKTLQFSSNCTIQIYIYYFIYNDYFVWSKFHAVTFVTTENLEINFFSSIFSYHITYDIFHFFLFSFYLSLNICLSIYLYKRKGANKEYDRWFRFITTILVFIVWLLKHHFIISNTPKFTDKHSFKSFSLYWLENSLCQFAHLICGMSVERKNKNKRKKIKNVLIDVK